jgi:polar amino acid transport system substrate-binding protein
MKHRLLIICLFMQPLLSWGGQTLRLAADEWPPFTGQGEERHIAQDLVAIALRKAGQDLTVSIGPWERAVSGVQAGKFDGLVAVWRAAERETLLLLSRPILENRIHAVTLHESDIVVGRVADLRDRVVGKVAGYAYGSALENAAIGRKVSLRNDRDGLKQLLAGDVDILLIDDLSLRYLLEELPVAERDKVRVQAQLASRQLHFALLRREATAGDIIRAFDEAIAEMMADGTYNQVLDLPWLLVDSDGDSVHEIVPGRQALDVDAPPAHQAYPVVGHEQSPDLSSRRVYLVGGQQYEDWDDAKEAIIDDAQEDTYDPLIQQNRYEMGVPF